VLQERVAKELGVEVGTYTHRSNSMHCYEKDFPLLANYVKAIGERQSDDLTYDYHDGWDEMMESEIPAIMQLIEDLKNNN
jgi:thymidylate synthase